MNEKALEAANRAGLKVRDSTAGNLALELDERSRMIILAAIEAYLAALSDEDGLVERLRLAADCAKKDWKKGIMRNYECLLAEAADALEAARAKIEDVQGLAYRQAEKLHEVSHTPEGWRLVPKEPTQEMCRAGGATQMAQDYKRLVEEAGKHLLDGTPDEGKPVTAPIHDLMVALVCYRAMLAAAPEISDE